MLRIGALALLSASLLLNLYLFYRPSREAVPPVNDDVAGCTVTQHQVKRPGRSGAKLAQASSVTGCEVRVSEANDFNFMLASPPAPGLTGVEKLADLRINAMSRAMTETDSPMVSLYPYVRPIAHESSIAEFDLIAS